MPEYGEMFTLTGATAKRAICNCYVRRNPFVLLRFSPREKFAVKKETVIFTAMRLVARLRKNAAGQAGRVRRCGSVLGRQTMFYAGWIRRARKNNAAAL